MATEYEMKTSDAAGPDGTESPVKSPAGVASLFDAEKFFDQPGMPSRHEGGRTYLYVIHCPPNFIKVGMAWNVESRMNSYRADNPHPVTLLRTFPFATRWRAALAERSAHHLLRDHQHRGEWFTCAPEVAIATVEDIIPHIPALAEMQNMLWHRQDQQELIRYLTDDATRARIDRQEDEAGIPGFTRREAMAAFGLDDPAA